MDASGAYGRDLALVHHRDFGGTADGAAKLLVGELRRRRLDGRVVDLGSGTGILAKRLGAAGHEVTGLEYSPAMIALARTEAPDAEFTQGSVHDLDVPTCEAVTAIGEVLNYRFDEQTSWPALRRIFARVSRALAPGGLFLFDLSAPGRGGPTGVTERFWDRPDYALVLRAVEDRRRRLLIRDHHVFIRSGTRYRRVDERHILRLFDPDRVVALLEETGFTVRRRRTYPGRPALDGWHVFLAAKPR